MMEHTPEPKLRALLLICAAFFSAVSLAHFFDAKIPVLFVYWDPPYYAYQDKIIAFAMITYALLYFAASRHREIVPYALISIWVTVGGLAIVNLSDSLASVLNGASTLAYWAITLAIAVLAAALTLLWSWDRAALDMKGAQA